MIRLNEIPDRIGYYMAGFTDGEGSFNVVFRPRTDFSSPWKVSLCFNVSQKDRVILALFKRYLQCGTLRGRPDDVWYFEVNNLNAIRENVIPLFQKYGFLSAKKKRDFFKFVQLAEILSSGRHRTIEGVREILRIRSDMNDGGKRRYTDEAILAKCNERILRDSTPNSLLDDEMIKSELHGDMKSQAEMS